MDSLIALTHFTLGLTILIVSGNSLISSAMKLGNRWNLSPVFMGTTIVAAGTSVPELVVAIAAQLENTPGVTLGNILGSNIFNIGMVLGIFFLWKGRSGVLGGKEETFSLAFITTVLLGLLIILSKVNPVVTIPESAGVMMILTFGLIMARSFLLGKNSSEKYNNEELERTAKSKFDFFRDFFGSNYPFVQATLGSAGLWFGGKLFVNGAVELAGVLGVSDTVVGLTIVAAGTGAPELIASLTAIRKGSNGIALGNVLGSNIFNSLGVIGFATIISPIEIDISVMKTDLIVMGIMTMTLALVVFTKSKLLPAKFFGAAFLLLYLWWCLRFFI